MDEQQVRTNVSDEQKAASASQSKPSHQCSADEEHFSIRFQQVNGKLDRILKLLQSRPSEVLGRSAEVRTTKPLATSRPPPSPIRIPGFPKSCSLRRASRERSNGLVILQDLQILASAQASGQLANSFRNSPMPVSDGKTSDEANVSKHHRISNYGSIRPVSSERPMLVNCMGAREDYNRSDHHDRASSIHKEPSYPESWDAEPEIVRSLPPETRRPGKLIKGHGNHHEFLQVFPLTSHC
jgi:hypothetical protein